MFEHRAPVDFENLTLTRADYLFARAEALAMKRKSSDK